MSRSMVSIMSITAAWVLLGISGLTPLAAQTSNGPEVVPCRASDVRYPVRALKTRQQGSVLLRVQVDAKGHASSVAIEQSSGSADLDRAARAGARQAALCRASDLAPATPGYADMRVDFKLEQLVARQ